ncbi:PREDICTED: polycomb group protein Psc-like [Dufourea novaeangliae]|uniref:polycomb group protein Psc-like n=1 Tax=Dufourea novaeangliae TaxID=178035 RepID=UPI000767CEF4|nr:PREDICTED: polycomb group protein Psc-like [Dufourea novaeangliae]
MSGQSGGHRLRLSKLNDQLTCKLCGGYFIDATTIIECLHSFCRSCIVKYLENNKYCPICEVQVHKSKPLLNIRPDHTLQDIVYKLVPGCYQNEMRCRREFYSKHPEACTQTASPEARGEPTESHIYSPDESLSLSLEYFSPSKDVKEITVKPFLRRYLRCPAAVTIFHLQKLIRAKYGLTDAHRVDVMYKEEPLHGSYTLMDVMYIYHWRRKVPLHLSYRIFESSPKRIKLSEDNVNYKTSLLHAGINPIELEEEKTVKREWKEVQLKISETGIMSITDISDQEFKKNTKAEEPVANVESVNTSPTQEIANGNNKSEITKKNELPSNKPITDDTDVLSNLNELDNTRNSNQTKAEKILVEKAETTVKIKNEGESKNESGNDNIENKTVSQNNVQSQETMQCVDGGETKCNVTDDRDTKESSKNNNNTIIIEKKAETLKQHTKNETKLVNTGSKINALSVKLQFQPKMGQINSNNNSSKKTIKDRKIMPPVSKKVETKTTESLKSVDSKYSFDTLKTQVIANSSGVVVSKVSVPCSTKTMSPKPISVTEATVEPVVSTHTTTTTNSESREVKSNMKSVQSVDQHRSFLQEPNISEKTCSLDQACIESAPRISGQTITIPQKSPYTQTESFTNENLATLNLTASLTGSLGNGISSTCASTMGQSTHTFSYTVQDLVNSTMLKNSLKSLATSTAQKLSATTIPENTVTTSAIQESPTTFTMPSMSISSSLKNNYPTSVMSASKDSPLKGNIEITSVYSAPPCPDAIPISLMKPTIRKNELITKGSNLNDICAKIGASGSKINDICAKIGENSKEKNKTETRSKSDIPDLLKIGRKSSSSSITNEPTNKQQQLTNISNIPVYAPSSNIMTTENKNIYSNVKDGLRATSLVSTSPMTTSHSVQKVPSASKKQTQAVGYKTLRDPPRCWNPTLSKNNYIAVKNQSKETQSQLHQTTSSDRSKTIQSKPAKIFKMRNMPRYLGNPASGVKPMYGIGNDSKEKEQSTITPTTTTNTSTSSKNGNLSMMKIDPKTLSPIVSTINSPIVSPPPYSPSARNYPNPPFSRDICRNTGSPISPKNSPVNMLSTSPFIPSPTPNMNPRLIYPHFPPPFPDATRFPNPLIRSPIGIPSPSAFHSSLPPSINKLYQRSSYIPQTTGFSPVSQPPTVQRIPPSTYSSPKSPKTTSLTAISPTSYGLSKSEAQIVATTSLETNNLLLLENAPQEDLSAFNLSKTGSFGNAENVKTSPEIVRNSKSTVIPPVSSIGQGKNTLTSTSKSKAESSQTGPGYDQTKEHSQEGSGGCIDENSYHSKGQNLEKKRSDESNNTVNKKKEKSVSQMNGNLASENNGEAPAEKRTEQQKEQNGTQSVQVSVDAERQQHESNHEKCEKTGEQEKRSEAQTSKTEV